MSKGGLNQITHGDRRYKGPGTINLDLRISLYKFNLKNRSEEVPSKLKK